MEHKLNLSSLTYDLAKNALLTLEMIPSDSKHEQHLSTQFSK